VNIATMEAAGVFARAQGYGDVQPVVSDMCQQSGVMEGCEHL